MKSTKGFLKAAYHFQTWILAFNLKYFLQLKSRYLGRDFLPQMIMGCFFSNQTCAYLVPMFVILQRSSLKDMVDFHLNVKNLCVDLGKFSIT